MNESTEQGVVKPEVVMLESLLDDIATGRLRVPRFQRPFVWSPEQMLELFDSIEGGYPIGSILVWETRLEVPSLDVVAGIDIPPPPPDGAVSYLLDGHQRLSTLFGTLVKRPPALSIEEDRPWLIHRRLGETPGGLLFEHTDPGDIPPADRLPLQAVLRTMDFLAYARRLARDPGLAGNADDLVDEAEQLAQRIKGYKIAVVRLVGGDLAHAVESFTRLNSGGRQVTPLDIFSALTFRADTPSLTDRVSAIRQSTTDVQFGAFPKEVIFQTILAMSGKHDVASLHWSSFATQTEPVLDSLVSRTEEALARVVSFLRYEAGIPLSSLVPFPLQVVLLAMAFDGNPSPDSTQTRDLVRWFWTTSWTGELRSALSFEHLLSYRLLRLKPEELGPSLTRFGRPRSLPTTFRKGDGRVRAYIAWEMREFNSRQDLTGVVFDAVDLYAVAGLSAYAPIAPSSTLRPENSILLPGRPWGIVEGILLRASRKRLPGILASHGIPAEAYAQLTTGDREGFCRIRRESLVRRENAFMREMGVEPPGGGQEA